MQAGSLRAHTNRIHRRIPSPALERLGITSQTHERAVMGRDQVWRGNVTYITMPGGWRQLAVVLDQCSRRHLGFKLGSQHNAEPTLAALRMALAKRDRPAGLVFHSDRGSEYAGYFHLDRLAGLSIVQSMNRPKHMTENAFVEFCFHTLKSEAIHSHPQRHAADLDTAVRRHIARYNRMRLRSPIAHPLTLNELTLDLAPQVPTESGQDSRADVHREMHTKFKDQPPMYFVEMTESYPPEQHCDDDQRRGKNGQTDRPAVTRRLRHEIDMALDLWLEGSHAYRHLCRRPRFPNQRKVPAPPQKPMIEIGGRPILWQVMKIQAPHGLTDFVVCLGKLINECFANYFPHMANFTFDLAHNTACSCTRGPPEPAARVRVGLLSWPRYNPAAPFPVCA